MKGLLGLFLLASSGLLGAAQFTTNSFQRIDIPLTTRPSHFAVGMLKPSEQIAIATVSASQLTLLLTNETGQFAPKHNIQLSSGDSVAFGDINADGKTDLIIGGIRGFNVHLNTGSAETISFAEPVHISAGPAAVTGRVVVSDLDLDGFPDVVTWNDLIYVSRNTTAAGVVTFAEPLQINATNHFHVVDLDGDQRNDLVVNGNFGTRRMHLNTSANGSLSFQMLTNSSSATAFADFNGDSKLDSITLSFPPLVRPDDVAQIFVSPNTSVPGAVSFGKASSAPFYFEQVYRDPRGRFPAYPLIESRTVTADFDLDGRVDLAISTRTSNTVTVIRNSTFPTGLPITSFDHPVDLPAPFLPRPIAVADVNRDGRPDLLAISYSDAKLTIFENRIEPVTAFYVTTDAPDNTIGAGGLVRLQARAYNLEIPAVEFLEDGVVIVTGGADGRAEYRPSKPGVRSLSARITAGPNAGLTSKATGLLVAESAPDPGRIVGLGDGPAAATILIYENGDAYGVGDNRHGELAHQFYERENLFVKIPAPPGSGGWKSISGGFRHVVGLTASGKVYTWGENRGGELGRVSPLTNHVPGEALFPNTTVSKVLADGSYTIALTTDGNLFSWGGNARGQLGLGHTNGVSTPTRIKKPAGVSSWKNFAVSYGHALALTDTGQLYFWGSVFIDGPVNPAPTLVPIPPGEQAWTNVAAGFYSNIGQTASGKVYVWGLNYSDALGLGLPEEQNTNYYAEPIEQPAPAGSDPFQVIEPGGQMHAALTVAGQLYVWGGSFTTPVGLPDTNRTASPTLLPRPPGVSKWQAISISGTGAVVLGDDGHAYSWGFNIPSHSTFLVNQPTQICSPVDNCGSNWHPMVKFLHPVRNDPHPLDGMVEFELAAADFDGFVQRIQVLQETSSSPFGSGTISELASLSYGERRFTAPLPASQYVSYYAVAFDQTGLASTSSTHYVTFFATNVTRSIALTDLAPTNALTGWQELTANVSNNSSFQLEALDLVLLDVPENFEIRNSVRMPPRNILIHHNYRIPSSTTTAFRIEFKRPPNVLSNLLRIIYHPTRPTEIPFAGNQQTFDAQALLNGDFKLEFDHAPGEEHFIQFTHDLANWQTVPLPEPPTTAKVLWIDNGAPTTPNHPRTAGKRFYRVLRR